MNINSVKEKMDKMLLLISNIKQMMDDYEACKSETSKKVLEAAICKVAKPLDCDTTTVKESPLSN